MKKPFSNNNYRQFKLLQGFGIRHILYKGGKLTKDGRAFLDRERPDICVFGHTHQP